MLELSGMGVDIVLNMEGFNATYGGVEFALKLSAHVFDMQYRPPCELAGCTAAACVDGSSYKPYFCTGAEGLNVLVKAANKDIPETEAYLVRQVDLNLAEELEAVLGN